jgi:phosphoglycolate phosphatase-like HAD superfamily hydrolase
METLIPILKHTGVEDYFDNIISCIDNGHKKPDPACLLDLMSQNGNRKEDFIYFGDSTTDSQFAANSGIDFIIFDQYLNEKNLFKKLINMFLEEQINGN